MPVLATAVEKTVPPRAPASKPIRRFRPRNFGPEASNPLPTGRFWSHRYRVWSVTECGPYTYCIYAAIASHADWNGHAWPGTDRLMLMTGFDRHTVFDSLRWLVAHKWIKIGKRKGIKGNCNVYQIVEPPAGPP